MKNDQSRDQKPIRYLVAADPAHKLYRDYDTTLRLISEALKIGIELDYLDLDEWSYKQHTDTYLNKMPVRKVLRCDPTGSNEVFYEFGPKRIAQVDEYDVILQRKDPPIDEAYRTNAAHFAHAPKRILQINDPTSATKYFEKELVQRYPEFGVPTEYCETFEQALTAVRAQKGEAVMKPSNLFSGIGIGFFKPDAAEDEIRQHWEKWKPCFVQPYLTEITSIGDLRILVINQKIIGAVLRVPAPGSRLGNLKQGARPAYFDPTPRQREAVAHIAKDLATLGLHFLGLDFIGDHLTECNMTCPTGVPQAENVSNEPVGQRLIAELEKLREEHVKKFS